MSDFYLIKPSEISQQLPIVIEVDELMKTRNDNIVSVK